ncbi:hypothetical protein D051_4052 [Vibrio parahaemolyticus VPCR-2010]|nr:hypothetical protein [Vibrio parahaemolyticus]EQM49604.1 hypothetical protein D051_4052 [Vibrio parahaemolyticus VPCR-2010]EGR2982599.1 hypothetical protein [Vibrio parahaemolyticus]OOX44068.1 hypothetical protein BJL77_21865 [Vibrio parahaemolyticus]OOX54175.1 hypothetical protein BJL78_02430 [Vibrio parahaemolyticus]
MNEAEAKLKLPPTNQYQVTLRPHTVKIPLKKMLLTTADTAKIFAHQLAHFDDMPYLTSAIFV